MPENNRYYLSKAPIWRSLAHLCVPMIAGLSVGVVYNIINAGFIGSLHSTALLAAITFSLPVFALLMAIGGVFGVGGGTYVSRLLGADANADTRVRIKQVSSFTFWGSLLGGTIVGALALAFLGPLVHVIGATGDAVAPTMAYVGVYLAFAPILVAAFALEQLVRAEGAAMASMTGLILSTVANLALDVVFILMLDWGVAGAALAVGLANVVMVGYYVWWMWRRSTVASLSPRAFRADSVMLRTVFGVGVSELLMSSFMIVTALMLNWIAGAYGDAIIASFGVAQRIAQLPEVVCMGIFIGVLPLLGFTFGAGDTHRLRAGIRSSALAIGAVTLVFSSAVFVFRDQVFGLFSVDPAVLTDGTLVLTAMLASTIFNGFTGLFIAVFQATEQMRNATIMSVAQGILFIPMLLGLNALFGLTGIIWSMTATELLTFALGATLFLLSRGALDRGAQRVADSVGSQILAPVTVPATA